MPINPNVQENQIDDVIEEIKNFKKNLNTWATELQVLAVLFPLLTIILSAMIASFAADLNDFLIRVFAFLSALCGVVSTTFQIEKKAKNMRDAFRFLNYSLYIYTIDGDIKKLIEAYNQAESIVGHVEVQDEAIARIVNLRQPNE